MKPSARKMQRPGDSPTHPDCSFPKQRRLLLGSQFTRILRNGSGAADDTLVVHVMRSQTEAASRLGVTIPRKTGNAVARNLWKRYIREAFRTQQQTLPRGYDVVVRPKKGALAQYKRVRRSLPYLAKKAVRRFEQQAG